jgi:hypothetical protein
MINHIFGAIAIAALLSGCAPQSSTPTALPEVPLFSDSDLRPAFSLAGGDTVRIEGDCFHSASWSLKQDEAPVLGRRLLAAESEDCPASQADADRVISLQDDTWLAAVHGGLLVLDTGTGPDGRDLTVLDLVSGEAIYRGPYVHDDLAVRANAISFWVPVDAPVDRLCSRDFEADGFGVGFERRATLNLASGVLELSDDLTCSPRQ